jgi:predicted ATP-grasp superfamily ATP-dependent carboligase
MRIFVYEFITALGIGSDPTSPEHSLYREGRAMLDAVTEDFRAVPGVEIVSLDTVNANEDDWIRDVIAMSEWQLIIAPEFDGILTRLVQKLETVGGRVLSPNSKSISLTSDKLQLAQHWRQRGVTTPATSERELNGCEIFPLVWKPRDGAGSTATFRLESAVDVARCRSLRDAEQHTGEMIMQEFVPGQPASLAFLTGPNLAIPLLPTFQHLSSDGRFKYLGGESPIPVALAERAICLGKQAISGIPDLRGWIGVDMVLGDAADGSRDYAIEINPRLTTSYVCLRKLAKFNLAHAMLQVANGECFEPSWNNDRVHFEPDGRVRVYPG